MYLLLVVTKGEFVRWYAAYVCSWDQQADTETNAMRVIFFICACQPVQSNYLLRLKLLPYWMS